MDEVNTCLLPTGTFSVDWKLYLNVLNFKFIFHTCLKFVMLIHDNGFPVKYYLPYSTAW